MAQATYGGSVQACAMRVNVLELDGVPLPGVGMMYTTDVMTKLDLTPVMTKGIDIEIVNACGGLPIVYKDRDRFKRFDLSLELATLDPELEFILAGGELFTQSTFSVGGAIPAVGTFDRVGGVSMELWSKHVVNGDQDAINPWIHWILPRTYWVVDKFSFMNGTMPRTFTGYTAQNPNFEDGPEDDWNFASDRTVAWAFSKTIPVVQQGQQTQVAT
jgi:hypothetical protein